VPPSSVVEESGQSPEAPDFDALSVPGAAPRTAEVGVVELLDVDPAAPVVGTVDLGSTSVAGPPSLPATPERDWAAGDVSELEPLPVPSPVPVPAGADPEEVSPPLVVSSVPVCGWLVDRSAHTVVVVVPEPEPSSEPHAPSVTATASAHAAIAVLRRCAIAARCPMPPTRKPRDASRAGGISGVSLRAQPVG
jgi:hypothetical protein